MTSVFVQTSGLADVMIRDATFFFNKTSCLFFRTNIVANWPLADVMVPNAKFGKFKKWAGFWQHI